MSGLEKSQNNQIKKTDNPVRLTGIAQRLTIPTPEQF